MYLKQLSEVIRHRLINVLSESARASEADEDARGHRYSADDCVAFVDLQNLHHFLKENCRVQPTDVHIVNLIREFGAANGLGITEILAFTGIHDPAKEPEKHEAMVRRIRWLQSQGVRVCSLPLYYRTDPDNGKVRAVEKGVDVRIASEMLRAVSRGLRNVLIVSQDSDLSEAVRVGREIAEERGHQLQAYSPALVGTQWPHNGRCGMNGVPLTKKIPMSLDLVRRHVRT